MTGKSASKLLLNLRGGTIGIADKPQNVQFIFECPRLFCQAGELVVAVLDLNQLLLQLLTVDPVIILRRLQPERSRRNRSAACQQPAACDFSSPEVLFLHRLHMLLQLAVLPPGGGARVVERVQLTGSVRQDVVLSQ